jgi:hypothetical protein
MIETMTILMKLGKMTGTLSTVKGELVEPHPLCPSRSISPFPHLPTIPRREKIRVSRHDAAYDRQCIVSGGLVASIYRRPCDPLPFFSSLDSP